MAKTMTITPSFTMEVLQERPTEVLLACEDGYRRYEAIMQNPEQVSIPKLILEFPKATPGKVVLVHHLGKEVLSSARKRQIHRLVRRFINSGRWTTIPRSADQKEDLRRDRFTAMGVASLVDDFFFPILMPVSRGSLLRPPQDRRGSGGDLLMPRCTVHFDKVGGKHHTVETEAASSERAIAGVRHEILLCLPEGTTPAEFDTQLQNFTAKAESHGKVG